MPSHRELLAYTESVQGEYAAFCAAHRTLPATRPFAYQRKRVADLAERVASASAAGEPFSLIRLGDGEGACLMEDADGPALRRSVMARTLNLHFGLCGCEPRDLDHWHRSVRGALAAAQVVAAPRPGDGERAAAAQNADIRGTCGVVTASRAAQTLPFAGALYESGHVHVDLLGHYTTILEGRDVGLVTCYGAELGRRMEAGFGCRVLGTVTIPPQAANEKDRVGQALYPAQLARVREETVALARPGLVLLVAAGLFGKELVVAAAEEGAVALDVGSVMDVWQGQGVRPYQTADFVARHTLPPGP